jgi:predicted enzyme related to lactoylglutathione lyase
MTMTTKTPETSSSPTINNVNWFEIAVSNLDKASPIYEATLDTKLKRESFMNVPHALFPCRDGVIGALITDPNRPVRAGHSTVIYLRVSDVEAALRRGVEAGAKVVQPTTSIGPQGTLALLADLDGNVFGIHAEAK